MQIFGIQMLQSKKVLEKVLDVYTKSSSDLIQRGKKLKVNFLTNVKKSRATEYISV